MGNCNNPYCIRTIVALIVNVVLVVLGIIFTVKWYCDLKNVNNYEFPSKKYCISCEKLRYREPWDVNRRNCSDGNKVCDEPEVILETLVAKALNKYRKEEETGIEVYKTFGYAECDEHNGQEKPAHHVEGALELLVDGVMRWKTPNTSTNRNITFDEETGSFVVNQSSAYYIYSQITLVKDRKHNATVCHSVHVNRIKGDHSEIVMESALSNCKMRTEEGKATSFVGGTVMLEKSERVFVKVSHKPKICDGSKGTEECRKGNFFGIHMV